MGYKDQHLGAEGFRAPSLFRNFWRCTSLMFGIYREFSGISLVINGLGVRGWNIRAF